MHYLEKVARLAPRESRWPPYFPSSNLLIYNFLNLTRGGFFFEEFTPVLSILGVCCFTFPAFVNDPCEPGISYQLFVLCYLNIVLENN